MSMLLPLVFQQVLAGAGLLVAPEDPAASEALKPLYVQIEVALDEVRVVPCRIEASESGGGIYDRAALDLDGDGDFETTVAGEKGILGTTDGRSSFCLPLVFDDAKFSVQLRGKLADPTQGKIYLYWTLDRGGAHLLFINGQAEAHGTAAAAAAGTALRLGPPFHFKTGSTMRGPDALVNVGLKDANGCTLRSARVAGGDSVRGTESQIRLTFLREGEPGTTIAAEYG